MLTELIKQEINKNFDTSRIVVDIIFDESLCYTAYGFGCIDSTIDAAQKNAKELKHAKIYIRDNTQSFLYDYNVEDNTLIQRDEIPGKYHRPLLEEDAYYENLNKKNDKELLQSLFLGSLPLILSIILFVVLKNNVSYILSVCAILIELFTIIKIVFKKVSYEM